MDEDAIEQAAEQLAQEAELHALIVGASQHLRDMLPPWFLAMNDAHHAEKGRLIEAGLLSAAAVFETCDPTYDDGAVCDRHHGPYPCKALRAVHDGADIWGEYVKGYPAGWEAWEDEWDTLGECHGCGQPVRDSAADWVQDPGDRHLYHQRCAPPEMAA